MKQLLLGIIVGLMIGLSLSVAFIRTKIPQDKVVGYRYAYETGCLVAYYNECINHIGDEVFSCYDRGLENCEPAATKFEAWIRSGK